MEIGLRILAVIIDLVAILVIVPVLAVTAALPWVVMSHPGSFGSHLLPFWFLWWLLLPIILTPAVLAVPTGLWGRSLGKLACGLYVTDERDVPPGLARAFARETLKLLAIGSVLGIVLTLGQIRFQGTTWYDQLCHTKVEHSPFRRLTQTQRDWRRHFRGR
jgi:uncharacterized RDD family membrane protein YckC